MIKLLKACVVLLKHQLHDHRSREEFIKGEQIYEFFLFKLLCVHSLISIELSDEILVLELTQLRIPGLSSRRLLISFNFVWDGIQRH